MSFFSRYFNNTVNNSINTKKPEYIVLCDYSVVGTRVIIEDDNGNIIKTMVTKVNIKTEDFITLNSKFHCVFRCLDVSKFLIIRGDDDIIIVDSQSWNNVYFTEDDTLVIDDKRYKPYSYTLIENDFSVSVHKSVKGKRIIIEDKNGKIIKTMLTDKNVNRKDFIIMNSKFHCLFRYDSHNCFIIKGDNEIVMIECPSESKIHFSNDDTLFIDDNKGNGLKVYNPYDYKLIEEEYNVSIETCSLGSQIFIKDKCGNTVKLMTVNNNKLTKSSYITMNSKFYCVFYTGSYGYDSYTIVKGDNDISWVNCGRDSGGGKVYFEDDTTFVVENTIDGNIQKYDISDSNKVKLII